MHTCNEHTHKHKQNSEGIIIIVAINTEWYYCKRNYAESHVTITDEKGMGYVDWLVHLHTRFVSRDEVSCECTGLSSTPPYLKMCLFSPSPDTSPAFPDAHSQRVPHRPNSLQNNTHPSALHVPFVPPLQGDTLSYKHRKKTLGVQLVGRSRVHVCVTPRY